MHSAHVPVNCVALYFIIIACLFCSLFNFCSTFVSFDSFVFHCSLFKRKIFDSDPGLHNNIGIYWLILEHFSSNLDIVQYFLHFTVPV